MKSVTIFGAIIFASFILVSRGQNDNKKKKLELKEKELALKEKELSLKENGLAVDSMQKIEPDDTNIITKTNPEKQINVVTNPIDVKKQIVNNLIAMKLVTQAEVNECGGVDKVISIKNIDLNKDGKPEFIADYSCIMQGFSVFRKIANKVEEIFDCRGCQRESITPLKTYTNGWRDLRFDSYSAGTGESSSNILHWNGTCYYDGLNPCPK